MKCPKCGSEKTRDILMMEGTHHSKRICYCGKFIKWLPNPDRDSVLHKFFKPMGEDYECVFGKKHNGKMLSEISLIDHDWLVWILSEDFPDEVHDWINSL